MHLGTSSRPRQMMPPQQRLRDTPPNSPPHSPTHSLLQASQYESSRRKRQSEIQRKKTRPKKTDVTRTRWQQSEEKLLAETYIQISEDPRVGINQTNKSFLGLVTSEYSRHASLKRTKDMITGKGTTLTRDCNKFVGVVEEHARVDVLKEHHKWRDVKAVVPGIHVRTAEDIEELNELFRDDTIPHPLGKPRPRKSQKSDSSESARFIFDEKRSFQGYGPRRVTD
ncbi:hypothetical protein Tco_1237058 [Tanacetum coccineum]